MKKLRHSSIVLAASLLLTACGQTAPEKFASAQEAFGQSDFVTARLQLISALQDMPGDQAMLTLLARTQLALGDGEGAASTIARLDPASTADLPELTAEADILRGQHDDALTTLAERNSADSWRLRALANIGLGNPAPAREAFEKGMQSTGPKAPLYASFARFELGAGNGAEARRLVKLALKEDPQLIDGWLVSGQLAVLQGRLQDALADYDRALKINPANFAARLGKTAALGDLGRLDEAQELLTGLAEESPDNLQIIYLQARMASAQEEWEDVRRILQPSEPAMRDNPRMQALYGQALLRMGLAEQARGWLIPLVRKYPGHLLARELLGEAQLEGGDAANALRTLRPLAERPDASPGQLALTAKAAAAAGDSSAKRYQERARMPAPEWVGGELAKADQSLRNGNWSDAAERYQGILDHSKSPNVTVLNNLAYATSQMGQQEEALKLALQALKIEPNHPSVMDTAGWLLVQTGEDRQRGIALLRAAASRDPDNQTIAKHLAAAQK